VEAPDFSRGSKAFKPCGKKVMPLIPCALALAARASALYKHVCDINPTAMPRAGQEDRTFFVTSVTFERRLILQSEPLCNLLLDVFRDYRSKGRFLLHEFVIMRNHFHAILTPAPDVPLEKAIQYIKGGFSFRAKREMHMNFEVWQKGSKEHRIKDAEDYAHHVEYIWNNPVRARLVSRPEDFKFSSAKLRDQVDPCPLWLRDYSFYVTSA
jgi:putative transposase